MNLKHQITKLHQQIDELPQKTTKELRMQLWEATEQLNEANFQEAEKIKETVAKKVEYLLSNCAPVNY